MRAWQGKQGKRFLPFEEARDYVRKLGFTGKKEWEEWLASGERPHDIPFHPNDTYRDEGWKSWPDWLGYGEGHSPRNEFLLFEEARDYARKLGFKGVKEWQEWSASGERPHDIPSNPDRTYRDEGWKSWPDWLGYGKGKPARSRGRSERFLPLEA